MDSSWNRQGSSSSGWNAQNFISSPWTPQRSATTHTSGQRSPSPGWRWQMYERETPSQRDEDYGRPRSPTNRQEKTLPQWTQVKDIKCILLRTRSFSDIKCLDLSLSSCALRSVFSGIYGNFGQVPLVN